MKLMLRVLIVTFFLNALLCFTAFADTNQAISSGTQWLLSQQNSDGSFGTDSSTIPLNTVETVVTLRILSKATSQVGSAIDYLNNYDVTNNDDIARVAAITSNSSYIQSLVTGENQDGGWGIYPDFESDNLDTVVAIRALKAVNYSDQTVLNNVVGYLLSAQNTDGGWGYCNSTDPGCADGEGDSNVYMTALVSSTLQQFAQTTSIATAINKATSYLIAHQNTDGGFGSSPSTVYETSTAYAALVSVITDNTVLGNAINYLASTQLSDGSWDEDPYSTALALRALYYSENKPTPPPSPTAGTVTGTVIDASTNQPLSGATVVVGQTSAETSDAGEFTISNVDSGSQVMSVGLGGYVTSTSTINVTAGSITNVSAIPLSSNPTAGIIKGTVTDGVTGQPLSGASVTVTGSYSGSMVTGTDGGFTISNVTPGTITITASLSGYYSVSGTGAVSAGGVLMFSPKLSTTPATVTTGILTGHVFDSVTKKPIQGAIITLAGSGSTNANTQGSFLIEGVTPGTYNVSITASGYASQSGSVMIMAGVTVDEGAVYLVPTPQATTVSGKVTDSATGQAIGNADAAIAGTGLSAKTDATGSYTIGGITLHNFTLNVSNAGYVTSTTSMTTSTFGSYELNIALDPIKPAAIEGTVVDAATNLAMAGVSVTLQDQDGMSTTTDIAGDFTLWNIPVGQYRLYFSLPGYPMVTIPVSINSGEALDLGSVLMSKSEIHTIPDTAYDLRGKFGLNPANFNIHNIVYDYKNNDMYVTTAETFGCGWFLLMRYDIDTDTGIGNLNNCFNPCWYGNCGSFSLAYDNDSDTLYIGGRGTWWGGLHSYSIDTGVFKRAITGGSLSGNMPWSMVYDPVAHSVYWGGATWDSAGGDFFRYNTSNGTSNNLTGKVPRVSGGNDLYQALYDPVNHVVYIGGNTGKFARYNTPQYIAGTHPAYPAPDTGYLINLSSISWGTSSIYSLSYDPDSQAIYIGGASGKFARWQPDGHGGFTLSDLTPMISEIVGSSSISALLVANGDVYIGDSSGQFVRYDIAAQGAEDLTDRISSFWGTQGISTLAFDSLDTAVFLGGPGGRFARYNIPIITATMDLSIDKTEYPADSDVNITATLTNISRGVRSYSVAWQIEDADGTTVGELPGTSTILEPGETKSLNATWNTGTTAPAGYRVHAVLTGSKKTIADREVTFNIIPDKRINTEVNANKTSYKANEQVEITGTVHSESLNFTFSNLTAQVIINDSRGSEVNSDTRNIPMLTPGETTQLSTYWNTSSNPAGPYTVTLRVLDSSTVLSTSTATFQILDTAQTGSGLVGTLTASPNPVYQGNNETFSYSVTNSGNEDLPSLDETILIVDPDTQEVKKTIDMQQPASMGVTISGVHTESTAGLSAKTYLAIMQAKTPEMQAPKTLASAPFVVKAGLEVTKPSYDISRVLVWLDYQWQSGQNCPDRALIEQALNEAGVSYHIVLDKADFQTELRNPYYTDFLILGTQNPIEDHSSEELREQVYSGKGLISALFERENLDGDVFGMSFSGDLSGRDYPVELSESNIATAGSFQSSGRALKVDALDPASVLGWTVDATKKGIDKYPGIIERQYGEGKVLYYAFDLGLSTGNYTSFADLLMNSLIYVHRPVDQTFLPGQFVPVEINVKSLGGAFDLRITEQYPQELRLYDPLAEQWITDNPWETDAHIGPDETETVLYYALTPDETGTFTTQTEVGYMDSGSYTSYKSLSTDIVVDKDVATVTGDILGALNALSVSGQDKAKANKAIRDIVNVQTRTVGTANDIEMNISDLLDAVDSLQFITSTDTSDIRLMIDSLIETWEERAYYHP